MSIEMGVLLGIAGCLAALVGLSSMRRSRRLRTHGVAVWAMALPVPEPSSEPERQGQILLQYTLEDGRVVERMGPASRRRGAKLEPGRKVLIWYDPADPDDVLVFGRAGRLSDWAFVTGGLLLVVAGAVVAAVSY
jgi:Protein of unknown function (DUF3592)